jgi:hypothetical protein
MKNFEAELRKLWRRTPFVPFTVEYVSGTKVKVLHPEAMTVHRGRGAYIDPKGGVWIFDEDAVANIVVSGNGRQGRRRRV